MLTTYIICGLVVLVAVMTTYILTNKKYRDTNSVPPSVFTQQVNTLISDKVALEKSLTDIKQQLNEATKLSTTKDESIIEAIEELKLVKAEKTLLEQELKQLKIAHNSLLEENEQLPAEPEPEP
ncbi:hypothetical protein AKH05_04125, partial [Vibrio parahaemolyticus]